MKGKERWAMNWAVNECRSTGDRTDIAKIYLAGLNRGLDEAAGLCEHFDRTKNMAILIRAIGSKDVGDQTGVKGG